MTVNEYLGAALIIPGLAFFFAGSVGMLRLPDLYSRLHALTKADNLGLGLLLLGVSLLTLDLFVAVKLMLIWILMLASGAASGHLIAQRARRRERGEWIT